MSAGNEAIISDETQEGKTVREQESIARGSRRAGGIRMRRLAATAAAVCAAVSMAVSAEPAWASWGFHTSVAPETTLASGVATDAAGELYVGNLQGAREYDLQGEPIAAFKVGESACGVALNQAGGELYGVKVYPAGITTWNATSGAREHAFSLSGTANVLGFLTCVQIASDSRGNVYVPAAGANKVEVFDAAGGAPNGAASEIPGLSAPEGVAVGPEGNVWVADTGAGKIEEFEGTEEEASGTVIYGFKAVAGGEITSPHVRAVALDGAGDIFASIGGEAVTPKVIEYNAKGEIIAEFGEDVLAETTPYHFPNGVAFDAPIEAVYVADSGAGDVQRFVSWDAATQPASNVSEGEATLHGTVEVEPGATVASCKLEYGTGSGYESSVPCESTGAGAGPYTATMQVTGSLTGVAPGAEYHYRIAAAGAGGLRQYGEEETFDMPGPASIEGVSAEAIVERATARAQIDPWGYQTSCEMQYLTEAQYEANPPGERFNGAQTVPCAGTIPAGYTGVPVSVPISNLTTETTYRYRFVAHNGAATSGGTTVGQTKAFATFGVESFSLSAFELGGEPFTQAGGHPYELIDSFRLNTSTRTYVNGTTNPLAVDANPKDFITELPAGLIGNPDATPKCKPYEVAHQGCSGATQVGVLTVYTSEPAHVRLTGELERETAPIYNLTPPRGLAAQFGARVKNYVTVHIDSMLRTGSDYGVSAEVIDNSTAEGVAAAEVTLWGVPAAESHDPERYCPTPGDTEAHLGQFPYETQPCTERGPLVPLLSNPTACTGEREARMSAEPWQETQQWREADVPPTSAGMPPITGCSHVHFAPSMVVQPTSKVSDSPSGLDVEMTIPQNEDPNGLATANLKDAKVTLPAGVTVNPSSANGLAGCPLLSGKEGHPGVSGIDLENGEAANCPDASKVGSVHVKTPLLEEELEGGVYVAQQNANPFKSLLALYIAAEAPERGVVIKLAGHVELNEKTGQLTTTFDENPQLPFETLKLDFFGGERAALATPRTCGSYQATSVLEPWSHQPAEGEAQGTPNAEPYIQPFSITSGPGGAACGGSPFAPGFAAGTAHNPAGGYSSFVMNLTRKDGEQRLSTVSMTMPPGISGMISHVTPCASAQAEAGDCPASSKIGHVTVEAGVGGEPIVLPAEGKPEDPVYLTEKYGGAPFGLSIVVPAEAGPFNLGKVVVRAKIEVNPTTAQVTVVSNPMPSMLQGIPLDVKAIQVSIDRAGFMFNPTSCEPMSVTGAIGSQEGASAAVSSRFQAAGCRGLTFKPRFSALIHAHHTRKDGEYLHVVVKSAFGQANIGKVHVQLPGKLPSRLETLKHACTEAQFAANPAGCPAESIVGHATAHTPVLPVPMRGPAIFVSHAGKGFPNLDLVLQGDGVHITLVGDTHIDEKTQVTTSTFGSVPDVPIRRFDLVLPAGPHSALAGTGNMCRKHLYMPTTLTGHNGAVVKHRTKIMVEGCKAEIEIVRHRVHHRKVTIFLHVPSAGRLIANGRGLHRTVKRIRKHGGRAAITMHLGRHDRHVLAKHPHQRINATIKLRFKPRRRHGKALHAHVKVLIG